MTATSPVLEDLNPAQLEAVTTLEGPLLVIAGAGSGKTRVITRRIARLIEVGVPAQNILAVTFTNKAAKEMQSRVAAMIGYSGATICTFHSFGARFLRGEADRLGRPSSFSLFDRSDTEAAVKTCLDAVGLDRSAYAPAAVVETIGRHKSALVDPDGALEAAVSRWEEDVAEVFRRYEELLERNGAFDFDDLLCKSVGLLQREDEVAARINERFRYVLVDEYQDVNRAQYELTRRLGDAHGNVCVTGDPDQCIYAWRGAMIDYILDFPEQHPGARVVRLEQNYRSVNTILRAASAVIRNNARSGEKELWSELGDGDPIVIRRVADEVEEARAVVERILTLRAAGVPARDVAVFYRLNSLSLPIERALLGANIPYQVLRGLEFFKRKEVKDVLAFLRFLVNRDDEISLSRIINVPARGIGAKTVKTLKTLAARQRISLGALLDRPDVWREALAKRAKESVAAFCALVAEAPEPADSDAGGFVRDVVRIFGYREHLQSRDAGVGADPLGNVEQLISFARDHDRSRDARGVSGFLEEVSLFTDLDTYQDEVDKVPLMTLHSAKGLEYPHVVMVGVDDDLFPHKGVFRPADEEEERRLFYVGLTRAMESVVLLTADGRTRFGRPQTSRPSPFLGEIPQELCTVLDDVAGRHGVELDRRVEYELEDDFSIRRGARVNHRQFGDGVVKQVSGRGADARVVIEFDDGGRRKFVLRYAGLEPVDHEI